MVRDKAIRVFGFTDIHWSVRDRRALAVAEAAQRYFKPDITIIMGDLLDCSPFSRHSNTEMVEAIGTDWIERELNPAKAWITTIQRYTKSHTHMLEGNHEAWIERTCANLGTVGQAVHELISPRKNLSRGRDDFSYHGYNGVGTKGASVLLNNSLVAVHGWTACKHAAASHLQQSRTRSIVFGHTHRAQRDMSRDPWSGKPIEAVSAGCLCKLQPIYAHGGSPTAWTHGFWVAYLGKNSYTLYAVTIHKGSAVMPDGKEIKA